MQSATNLKNIVLFKDFKFSLGDVYINLEERFMLKVVHFLELSQGSDKNLQNQQIETSLDQDMKFNSNLDEVDHKQFFEALRIVVRPVKFSIVETDTIHSKNLLKLKQKIKLKLVTFENANLDFRDYKKSNLFENFGFISEDLKKHYSDQIMSQAIKLLGTVDFLGNPVGLISDVRDGIKDLVTKRDVGSFISNSVHGVTNSTGKIAGTVSNVFSSIHRDNDHNIRRAKIRAMGHNSGEHFSSGVTSLFHGLHGMTTSLYTSTVDGAKKDGFLGIGTGLAKGLAGTVTKPVAGVLDFAGEMALSVRDKVGSNQKMKRAIKKIRQSRVTTSMSKSLQPYNFYESIALSIFELELENEMRNSEEDFSLSAGSSQNSSNGSHSGRNSNNSLVNSRLGSSASTPTNSPHTGPTSSNFQNSLNYLDFDREVFYLGRVWDFCFVRESGRGTSREQAHNCYITNKKVVFYISKTTDNSKASSNSRNSNAPFKISYEFPFEVIKKCEVNLVRETSSANSVEIRSATGLKITEKIMIVKKDKLNGMEELIEIFAMNDNSHCSQLVFLINKAISLWYETTHYVNVGHSQ